jgi:hypothetical protein
MGMVYTVPEAALDYVLYGDNSAAVSNYLQHQMKSMQGMINPVTDKIYNAMLSSYNYVNDNLIKTGIMSSLRQNHVQANNDYFEVLTNPDQLRNANATMQRWVMAHPGVKAHYLAQNVDGYSDSYTNVFGKGLKEDDYNYRQVMNGVLVDHEEFSEYSLYYDHLHPGDRLLTYDEQMTVLSTWDHIDHILKTSGIDFTHQTNQDARINKED